MKPLLLAALLLGALAVPAEAKFVQFQSPSKNIGCAGDGRRDGFGRTRDSGR